MTGAPPKPSDCQKPLPGAPVIGSSDWLGHAHANILEALGSIIETRCFLQKMRRLSEEGPMPDWTAVMENLQGALRESDVVLVRVQRLYNAAANVHSSVLLGPLTYQPEIWRVEKDTIYAAIPAVEAGLEYARECLSTHETSLGRTTLKNKMWAETMENDIRHMERTLEMLRACRLALAP